MSSNQPLTDRAEAVYRELRSMRRRFRLGAWITLIVGGLLLLLVATYFSYGYSEISSFRDPELIVSLVGNTVDQQIPIVRQRLESEVKTNAPAWAEEASKQVLAAVPSMREQLERLALDKSDEMIVKIDVVSDEQFRRILDENRATVQNSINQLKKDETISEELLLTLQEAIEKELQIDAKNQADALLAIVTDLNANMEKLHAGEDLSREQKAERRVLMLARRLQIVHLGDITADDLAEGLALPDVVKDRIGNREEKRLRIEQTQAVQAAGDGPAKEPEEKKEAPSEEEPAAKPEEKKTPAEKPAAKPEEKKAPAEKPAAKPEEKKAPAEKPAAKPEEKKAPEEKPADKPEEPAKPAEKPEEKKDEG